MLFERSEARRGCADDIDSLNSIEEDQPAIHGISHTGQQVRHASMVSWVAPMAFGEPFQKNQVLDDQLAHGCSGAFNLRKPPPRWFIF